MSQNATESPSVDKVKLASSDADALLGVMQDFVEARLYAAVEAAGFDLEEDEAETYDRLSVASLVIESAHDGRTVEAEDLVAWLDGAVSAFVRRWTEQRG